jgi:hypothetical protein
MTATGSLGIVFARERIESPDVLIGIDRKLAA